jgi:hypothetical protein
LNIKLILKACFGLLCLVGPRVHFQDTQFLTEIDAHLTLNSYLRTYLQAKDDREGGDSEQFTQHPNLFEAADEVAASNGVRLG